MLLGNPWGLLALVGLPAVLAIHMLQRAPQRFVISTNFLLDAAAPRSATGRRFDRLRQSVPLWIQLATVVVLTWVLVDPRWPRIDPAQRVVLVLDGSASMSASAQRLRTVLPRRLDALSQRARSTEWIVLDSDATRAPLYSGADRSRVEAILAEWRPARATHDPNAALLLARDLARGNGVCLFVTDHVAEVPAGVHIVAVGEPQDNVGLSGLVVEPAANGARWKTVVRNYGAHTASRTWWTEIVGHRSEPQVLELAADEMKVLEGRFPDGNDSLTISLSPDALTLDDSMPVRRPRPKPLRVRVAVPKPLESFTARLIASGEAIEPAPAGSTADVHMVATDPSNAARVPGGAAIVFVAGGASKGSTRTGAYAHDDDPLVHELNWQGLQIDAGGVATPAPGDRPLLLIGDAPVVFLRGEGLQRQLWINFDPMHSNALHVPAFVVLLDRYLQWVRAGLVREEDANFDTAQALQLAVAVPGESVRLEGTAFDPVSVDAVKAAVLRAPERPGFFEVRQGDAVRLRGAAQFGDARESDLRGTSSADDLGDVIEGQRRRNALPDPLRPMWFALLGAFAVANWGWRGTDGR